MDNLFQDFRYGLRVLVKNPAFSAVAILTLALGIGANTAIFSVIDAVLLRPFPYEDPERLVITWEANLDLGLPQMVVSSPNYADWREQNRVFDEMAAFRTRGMFLGREDELVRLHGVQTTSSLFAILDTQPILGRLFHPDEDLPGSDRVVLLSHALWQSRFGSDPDILGRTVELDSQGHTVVGIMPRDFNFPPPMAFDGSEGIPPDRQHHLWTPIARDMKSGSRGAHNLTVVARLREGVGLERAENDLNAIAARLEEKYPDINKGWRVALVPLQDQVLGDTRPALLVLMAAVAFVLLIACVNVANLLLARGTGRQKEFAIRAALGAGQIRLVRQLLTESFILSLLGGAIGMILAFWGVKALLGLAPPHIHRLQETALDAWVILFTVAISVITGMLFGLAPAFQSFVHQINPWLKEGGRSDAQGGGSPQFKNALTVVEVALSLVLLVGAGLLFQSFLNLRGVDYGFEAENVLTMQVTLPRASYSEHSAQVAAYGMLEEQLNAIPGIDSAGFIYDIPLAADRQGTSFLIEGEPPPPPEENRVVNVTVTTPQYHRSIGIPLLAGRYFTEQDGAGSAPVVVINESLARRFFAGEDPIGRGVLVQDSQSRRIVGVVGDVRHNTLRHDPNPTIYAPFTQGFPTRSLFLVARTRMAASTAASALRGVIREFDPQVPIYDIRTMEEILSDSMAQPRFSSLMLGLFSGLALVLASIGIYGVISYSVSRRTAEMGIRMALGAGKNEILKLVTGEGLRPALLGVALGLIAALILTRYLESLLFDVTSTDPLTLVAVSALLLIVAFLACYVPARRAARVDPNVALRYE